MWTEFLSLMTRSMMLRLCYEFIHQSQDERTNNREATASPIPDARQKEWADKAVTRYAASQEKKWQRWNEAMFEKVE